MRFSHVATHLSDLFTEIQQGVWGSRYMYIVDCTLPFVLKVCYSNFCRLGAKFW